MRSARCVALSVTVVVLTACGPGRPGGIATGGVTGGGTADATAGGPGGTADDADTGPLRYERGECAGAFPADARRSPHLAEGDVVVSALVCDESLERVPADGEWKIQRTAKLSPAELDELVAGLRVPDATPMPNRSCNAMGYIIPPWVLTLADGRHVQPKIPGDGCAPSQSVLAVLNDAAKRTDSAPTRLRRVRPETQVASGCYDGTKFMVPGERIEVAEPPTAVRRRGPATVCRFDMTDGSGVETTDGIRMPLLAGTGATPAVTAAVKAMLSTFRPGKPASCTTDQPTAVLTVQPPSQAGQADTGPDLYVEVGGCGLVLNADLQLVGAVDVDAAQRLSALATDPVVAPVEY